MELLVYMAIVGIVVIVAGQAFSDSTKMRIRTQGMIKANEIATNIGAVIKDDISQMGAKSSKEYTGAMESDGFSQIFSDVYMDLGNVDVSKIDSSSFKLTLSTDNQQDFKFRRIRYDAEGRYRSTEEIRWYLEDETLKRSCWTVAYKIGTTVDEDDLCTKMTPEEAISVVIAENVTDFNIIPGKPKETIENLQMFPHSGDEFMLVPRYGESYYNLLTVNNSGSSTEMSGFASNFDQSTNQVKVSAGNTEQVEKNQLFAAEYVNPFTVDATSWKSVCSINENKFSLETNTTYEISFDVAYIERNNKMGMFLPERDALSVGFRDASGSRPEQIPDFYFYPPVADVYAAKTRSMRFSVGEAVENVCLAFTFASFSPIATMGSITIENLKLKKVATANYTFDPSWNPEDEANIKDKKNVKAFKLRIGVAVDGEKGSIEQLILAPSNGPRD